MDSKRLICGERGAGISVRLGSGGKEHVFLQKKRRSPTPPGAPLGNSAQEPKTRKNKNTKIHKIQGKKKPFIETRLCHVRHVVYLLAQSVIALTSGHHS